MSICYALWGCLFSTHQLLNDVVCVEPRQSRAFVEEQNTCNDNLAIKRLDWRVFFSCLTPITELSARLLTNVLFTWSRICRGLLRTVASPAEPALPITGLAFDARLQVRTKLIADPPPKSTSTEVQPCADCGANALFVCPECERKFCPPHIYRCSSCDAALCGLCLDAHRLAGHWDDSDTSRERYGTQSLTPLIQTSCIA